MLMEGALSPRPSRSSPQTESGGAPPPGPLGAWLGASEGEGLGEKTSEVILWPLTRSRIPVEPFVSNTQPSPLSSPLPPPPGPSCEVSASRTNIISEPTGAYLPHARG